MPNKSKREVLVRRSVSHSKNTTMTSSALDSQVEPGFSKGSLYEKHRATYASDAVQLLLDNLQVSGKRDARILDLAAGTGKFTEALAAREEQYQIVAVEPLESMRSVLAEKSLLNTEVKDGHAGEIPVEDGSIDAVVIAQVSVVCSSLGFQAAFAYTG